MKEIAPKKSPRIRRLNKQSNDRNYLIPSIEKKILAYDNNKPCMVRRLSLGLASQGPRVRNSGESEFFFKPEIDTVDKCHKNQKDREGQTKIKNREIPARHKHYVNYEESSSRYS